jgi:hypothetical protein
LVLKYSTKSEIDREDITLFDDIIENMIKDMKILIKTTSISSFEKFNYFVRCQYLECIKLFDSLNIKIDQPEGYAFFEDFNLIAGKKIKEFYLALFDQCIESGLFELSINKDFIFETIQDIIIYFIQTYHENTKISSSIEYVEDAIELLLNGLKKGSGVTGKKLQVI